MERLQRFSNDTLMPNDLDKVRIVFNEVVKQAWFDPNDYSKEGFESKLIVLFQCGIVRSDQLTKVAFLLALNDFCHDTERSASEAESRLQTLSLHRTSAVGYLALSCEP